MKILNRTKVLLMLLSLFIGISYYFLIKTNISNIEHTDKRSNTFTFRLTSHIKQNVKLHIATNRYKLNKVECSGKEISFPPNKMQWFEGIGEQVSFSLLKGVNYCSVTTNNLSRVYTPTIKQKITFFDYIILFIFAGIPLLNGLFIIFIWILDKFRNKKFNTIEQTYADTALIFSFRKMKLLSTIIVLGILIRVLYFHKFGIMNFQHDWHGHIEFIKYISENWTFPLASKGLEYPQQPLYYLITGGLYWLLNFIGMNEQDALYSLGYISLISSIILLYYGYKFMTLVTNSLWVRTVAMLFLSLTPSLVYLCARINNDALVMALSAFSLYFIVKSYRLKFKEGFYTALVGVSLLFMTKISASPIELLLFGLLLVSYYRANNTQHTTLKTRIYHFCIVGIFLLGFTLLRVYLPIEDTFHMVNSSAHYPNMEIEALNFGYFGTFNIASLLNVGYSHIYGDDSIRYSLLTYQYGTMFFGEFDYSYFLKTSEGLQDVMQVILLLGLAYLLGLIRYLMRLPYASLLEKFLFATLLINLLLILKFIFSYPVVCNTDFRYFVPSFILFALVFAKGLDYLGKINWMRYFLNIILGLLAMSQVLFFIFLLIY